MSADTAANFFAMVLLVSAGGLVVALATRSVELVAPAALTLAALVALGAMAGSLYFSEIANFVPCRLCWYQRFAMYPLGFVLGLAAWRNARRIVPYAALLAGAGLLVSLYHVQLQLFPEQASVCDAVNPCSGSWVEGLGFMTIPQMASLSFLLVLVLLAMSHHGTGDQPSAVAVNTDERVAL